MDKPYVDIAILAPLEEEAQEIFQVFTAVASAPTDGVLISNVSTGDANVSAVVVQLADMGVQPAYAAAKAVLSTYKVGVLVCVGIAGRVSDDLLLGDVCYTGQVIDVTDRQKVSDEPRKRGIKIELSTNFYETPSDLIPSLNYLRTDPLLRARVYNDWLKRRTDDLARAINATGLSQRNLEMFRPTPTSRHGKIACGPVSASKAFINKLLDIDRKMLVLETESGGVFKAAQEVFQTPALTIRGVSDFADPSKGKLEKDLKGLARSIAARNAVTFLQAQLQNPYFVQYLRERKLHITGERTSDLFTGQSASSIVSDSLRKLSGIVEQKLKELCPEFKMQQAGYHLPAPRLHPIRIDGDPRATEDRAYYELSEVLTEQRAILADLPLTYPSESFPWVVCENLLQGVISEKQSFPIPIDGKRIAPPKGDLVAAASVFDFSHLVLEDGAQIIFVIYDFDLDSITRTKHLLEELAKYPEARVVIVSRGRGPLAVESEIVKGLGARCYSVGDVPFIAISHFIQSNFGLPPAEAEVIAFRMHSAFERFKLPVHPTYFAGISRDMLSALLQATRRSELIQLAVDGLLTLLVAEDAGVPISRTTRRRFLSELAVELAVEKRSFTEQELKSFARAFAERHDFDIDAGRFVDVFIEKGVIRFEDGQIEFTLPFIEHYLLAVALSKDEALALRHFSLDEDTFDDQTFDLYTEIGASQKIIDLVLTRLQEHHKVLQADSEKPDVFLTDELKPKLLAKIAQISDVRRSLLAKVKKLTTEYHDGEGKQRILDVGAKTVREVGKSQKGDEKAEAKRDLSKLNRAVRDWRIGCILLGGAAEQLVASEKQKLISSLVALGSATIDVRTREYSRIDFEQIKKTIRESAEQDGLFEGFTSEEAKKSFSELIDTLLDLFELATLGQPFMSTLAYLCEGARHRVLSASIEKSEVGDGQPSLIKAVWLTDIDAKRGKTSLRKCVKELPPAVVLRILLATHFVERVYWAQWRSDQREALLEAAQETLKALGLSYPKDKMLRIIGRDSGSSSDSN